MANTVSHQWPPFFAKPKDQLVGQTIDRVDHSLLLHLLLTHQPSWVSSFLGWILCYMLATPGPWALSQPAIWLPILSLHWGLPIQDSTPTSPHNSEMAYLIASLYTKHLSVITKLDSWSTSPKLAPPSRYPLPAKGTTIHPVAQANFAKILILFLLSSHFQSSSKSVDSGFQKKHLDGDHFFSPPL